jgi:hypothetical protein
MQPNKPNETDPKLDHTKLLGFRGLAEVTKPGTDLGESADQMFQKRGSEGPAPN